MKSKKERHFFVGPTNKGHLFDHPLWSIFQSVVGHIELLYTLKITSLYIGHVLVYVSEIQLLADAQMTYIIHNRCYACHTITVYTGLLKVCYPPASKVSREAANLTEGKNPHTPVYKVKEFACLWSTLTQIISGLAEQNGLKKFRTSLAK